jgi:biotin/methionine sulfoxide reductase
MTKGTLTSTHWGTYRVESESGTPTALHPFEEDPNPSPIGNSMLETLSGSCRIDSPMVRRGFLEKGVSSDRAARGKDEFVRIGWDQALDLVASELNRVRDEFGNAAIYGGSYGWASAGRFHHAQSQLKRFMNLFGGSTVSRNTYSYASAEVIMPHVVGPMSELLLEHTSWRSVAQSGALVIAFGGMAPRNGQVNAGGTGRHSQAEEMLEAKNAGVEFVNISPDRSDIAVELNAEWIAIKPNTDVALMFGLAHTIVENDWHDTDFLDRCCTGFDRFLPYLNGITDGQPKDASWASAITGIPTQTILTLARRITQVPTVVNTSWSLTRQQNAEHIYWMLVVLTSLLGGIGKPGSGFGLGLGAVNGVGSHRSKAPWAAFPTGTNPIDSYIPVARVADMLENPRGTYKYDGMTRTYPDIKLAYWVGGNPFHHHQDLNRLRRVWQNLETVIVHEPFWTPLARHADIVLPATVALERNDLGASPRDDYLIAMRQAATPHGLARNDHDIFAALSERLPSICDSDINFKEAFAEGKDEEDWLQDIYKRSASRIKPLGFDLPDYETFIDGGFIKLTDPKSPSVLLQSFRDDPEKNPLTTPSGRIEIFSEVIASFGLPDFPGHPIWCEPLEWLGSKEAERHPLHMITHQPARRLHSQLDHGSHSRAGKINGREPCRINSQDAAERGITEGSMVRIFNQRGSCVSAAQLDPGVLKNVIMMATGAWYDPDWDGDENCCKHGNPNTLTKDLPTSELGQGPGALTCLVEIEKFVGIAPDVTAFVPPKIVSQQKNYSE